MFHKASTQTIENDDDFFFAITYLGEKNCSLTVSVLFLEPAAFLSFPQTETHTCTHTHHHHLSPQTPLPNSP